MNKNKVHGIKWKQFFKPFDYVMTGIAPHSFRCRLVNLKKKKRITRCGYIKSLDEPQRILNNNSCPAAGNLRLQLTWLKWPHLKIGKVMFSAKWHLAVHSFAHKWNKTLRSTTAARWTRSTDTVKANRNGSALAHEVDKFHVHRFLSDKTGPMQTASRC